MSLAPHFKRPARRVVADAAALIADERLRKELVEIGARLAEYEGSDADAQAGCRIERMTLGSADVLVEFEIEEASGDGWNEPRIEFSATPIQVYINGAWCDIEDVVPASVADAWTVEAIERWADEADAAKCDAAEAARDFA